MKISVVLPAYNEEATLQDAVEEIGAILGEGGHDFEIIIVDDGSHDRTWSIVERLAPEDRWNDLLMGVRFSRNFGKEAAIVAGLQHASGDAAIVMDADLQHPPALIPRMIELWSQGQYLVVEGVKQDRQRESLPRRLSSKLFYRILQTGGEVNIGNSTDFKLLDRRVIDMYLRLPERGRFFRGLTAWIGLPTAQLNFQVPERAQGTTRWRFTALLNFARSAVISFTPLPLRLISWIGLFGLFMSIVLTLQTLWNKFFGASAEGFPTVIILILGMGSLILLCLGIIGEYLSELYREVKRRPLYVVLDTLQINADTAEVRKHEEKDIRNQA